VEWRPKRVTVDQYLSGPETLRRRELLVGHVREPPAPFWSHQSAVTRLTVLLDTHVRAQQLGRVCVSPIDVVLDRQRALIVQPDVIFVSNDRLSIVDKQVWGAPDLVVEVLSTNTERRDQTVKARWYRQYGVRECWLVSPYVRIEVLTFQRTKTVRRSFRRDWPIASAVLPALHATADDVSEE
jgi:Uma2 family endonuclease